MSVVSDGMPRSFETAPERYRHWRLAVDGRVARLTLAVDEAGALTEGVPLKRNSYDLGVDIELRDVVQRLRFEHPEVGCVIVDSALSEVFCAGANIGMLARSSHPLKVNFCKLTNETRFEIEDATRAGQRWIAALSGTASGGGYELALACDRILLVDDRRAAVSLPELPLLAVLPEPADSPGWSTSARCAAIWPMSSARSKRACARRARSSRASSTRSRSRAFSMSWSSARSKLRSRRQDRRPRPTVFGSSRSIRR